MIQIFLLPLLIRGFLEGSGALLLVMLTAGFVIEVPLAFDSNDTRLSVWKTQLWQSKLPLPFLAKVERYRPAIRGMGLVEISAGGQLVRASLAEGGLSIP
jgi:hypothetical protein